MGDRRCCCEGGCVVLHDGFNRVASTNLGSDWVEVTGDSEIVVDTPTNSLEMPFGAVVRTVAETGETDEYAKVAVVCKDVQVGDVFRVLICYDIVTDDYEYGELECTGTGADNMTLRVGTSSGGDADSDTFTYTTGQDMNLLACRTLEGLYISSEATNFVVAECVGGNVGRYAGLMNDSAANTVHFDDFIFIRGFDAANERCFYCSCECEGHCVPDTLTMTFHAPGGAGNLCWRMDGNTITLNIVASSDEPIRWTGSGSVYDSQGGIFPCTGEYELHCYSDPWLWVLYDIGACPDGYGWDGAGTPFVGKASPNAVSCDPISLTFPDNLSDTFWNTITPPCSPSCDCSYTITITE